MLDDGGVEELDANGEEQNASDVQNDGGANEDDGGTSVDDVSAPNEDTNVHVRRSTRERQPSMRYSPNEYVLLTDGGEPESFNEAILSKDKEKWLEAMQEEMNSLHENCTYDLVLLPKGKKALKNK